MVVRQTQRVHEHHGHRITMMVNSRAVLTTAAILAVLAAVINNVLDGGTTFGFLVLALSMILAVVIWLLFDSEEETTSSSSTIIPVQNSIGQAPESLTRADSTRQEDLPDPLDSGIDVPLL